MRTVQLDATALVLLCSDGLWNVATAEQIAPLAGSSAISLADAADALVALANDAGGPDNITVILCKETP